jgi:hypothetical protein
MARVLSSPWIVCVAVTWRKIGPSLMFACFNHYLSARTGQVNR